MVGNVMLTSEQAKCIKLAPLTKDRKAKVTATAALTMESSGLNKAEDKNITKCSASRGLRKGCSSADAVTNFSALLTKLEHKPDSIQGVGKDRSLCMELTTAMYCIHN
jgi:hypothetical protein